METTNATWASTHLSLSFLVQIYRTMLFNLNILARKILLGQENMFG